MNAEDLAAWHRKSIDNPEEIRSLLEGLLAEETVLRNGMDHRNRPRTAKISQISRSSIELAHKNLDSNRQPVLVFSFDIGGSSYSFAGVPSPEHTSESSIRLSIPDSIHLVERRGRLRNPDQSREEVSVQTSEPVSREMQAFVTDRSRAGIGLRLQGGQGIQNGSQVLVIFRSGGEGTTSPAIVRHVKNEGTDGWMRVGLALQPAVPSAPLPIERRDQVLPGGTAARGWSRVALAGRTLQLTSNRLGRRVLNSAPALTKIDVVEFQNQLGQPIRGIVDRAFDEPGGPGIIIPPAWGRTKETLLPLARTLVETFRAAGEPITVLRFDGTQRRGESFVDSSCRASGDEALHFTFSQAAADVNAAARFLMSDNRYEVENLGLVTFSLAALEGRIALVSNDAPDFSAWVATVGMTDVQSALKSVSGGIDYVVGKEAGVAFGVHELGGVRIDIDHAADDVLTSDIATLEEAKRDIAKLSCPLTWIHGRDDGWTDSARVQEMLSVRGGGQRKIIEVPTGHQLRNSTEALDTFQLIAHEISEPLTGRRLTPALPELVDLDSRNREERARIGGKRPDLRAFWQDYLLGKDVAVGMQLLGATDFFRDFMLDQIERLDLRDGMRVLDLGAGTGEFTAKLFAKPKLPNNLRVVSLDFVSGALRRARDRVANNSSSMAGFCVADVNQRLPFADDSFDRVLSSLLIAYIDDAPSLVAEIRRVLKPGGILVLSSPRRDADLSSLYHETISSITPDEFIEVIGAPSGINFDEVQRAYLNEAARLVDYEEAGHFQFRDPEEMSALLEDAGFDSFAPALGLGSPPQSAVVTGRRRE